MTEKNSDMGVIFDLDGVLVDTGWAHKQSWYDLAEEEGLIFRWSVGPRKAPAYATVPQSQDEPQDDNKRAAVEALLASEPGLSTKEVAERCGVSWQYANRIRRAST